MPTRGEGRTCPRAGSRVRKTAHPWRERSDTWRLLTRERGRHTPPLQAWRAGAITMVGTTPAVTRSGADPESPPPARARRITHDPAVKHEGVGVMARWSLMRRCPGLDDGMVPTLTSYTLMRNEADSYSLTCPGNSTMLAATILCAGGRSMETLEANPVLPRAHVWARLSDPNKPPRSW